IGPVMFGVALLDRYLSRRECFLHRRAIQASERVSPYVPLMLRLGVSAFFTAVFVYGCLGDTMILTPELRTHHAWICWLQLAIAVSVLIPQSAVVAGSGIIFLYAYAVVEYGLF